MGDDLNGTWTKKWIKAAAKARAEAEAKARAVAERKNAEAEAWAKRKKAEAASLRATPVRGSNIRRPSSSLGGGQHEDPPAASPVPPATLSESVWVDPPGKHVADGKLRIAVCFSGFLNIGKWNRGKNKNSLDNFRQRLSKLLKSDIEELDAYLFTWNQADEEQCLTHCSSSSGVLPASSPLAEAKSALRKNFDDVIFHCEDYDPMKFIKETIHLPAFQAKPAESCTSHRMLAQHYGAACSAKLLDQSTKNYDFAIMTRLDMIPTITFDNNFTPSHEFYGIKVLPPREGNSGGTVKDGLIDDRFIFSTQDIISSFSKLYSEWFSLYTTDISQEVLIYKFISKRCNSIGQTRDIFRYRPNSNNRKSLPGFRKNIKNLYEKVLNLDEY